MKSKRKLGLLMIIMVSMIVFLVMGCTNGASGTSSSEKKTTTEQTDSKDAASVDGSDVTATQEEERQGTNPVDNQDTDASVTEPINYLITFDSNGGVWSGEVSQEVGEGSKITEPQENPIKKGMSFAGWYVKGNTDSPHDFDVLVTESVTLVAKFSDAQVGFIAYGDGSVSQYVDTTKTGSKGPVGIVIEVTSGVATKIVALQESDEVQMNKGTRNPKATNHNDGKENRKKVEELQRKWSEYDQFPASEYCDDYKDISQNAEWYLPAKNELKLMYEAKNEVNAALNELGNQAVGLSNGFYWSSTQNNDEDTSTWCISLESGTEEAHRHGLKNLARPIRVF